MVFLGLSKQKAAGNSKKDEKTLTFKFGSVCTQTDCKSRLKGAKV